MYDLLKPHKEGEETYYFGKRIDRICGLVEAFIEQEKTAAITAYKARLVGAMPKEKEYGVYNGQTDGFNSARAEIMGVIEKTV